MTQEGTKQREGRMGTHQEQMQLWDIALEEESSYCTMRLLLESK